MTLYLGIDTATDLGSAAVGEPGRVAAELRFTQRRHGAALLPAILQLLRITGARLEDLSGIVVADGPGSFTGLRIGTATAQGLIHARRELRLLTAPSLLAAAWNAHAFGAGTVAALYDALRGEVFAAVYAFEGAEVRTLVGPVLTTVTDLTARAPGSVDIAVGDGTAVCAAAVRRWIGRDPVGPPHGAPTAGALLELLAVAGAVHPVPEPAAFEPEYGRKAEAEVRWERRHGRPLPYPSGDRD